MTEPENMAEILEVANRVSSMAGMLRLYMEMLCLEENCTMDELKIAIMHRKSDGSGRVGPSWAGKEFLNDLTKLHGLLNVSDGPLFTPWSTVQEKAKVSVSDALDTIFNEIDDAGMAGKFEEIDSYLETIPFGDYKGDMSLWVGVLSISWGFSKVLKKRGAFFEAVKAEAVKRGRDLKGLLGGLENDD